MGWLDEFFITGYSPHTSNVGAKYHETISGIAGYNAGTDWLCTIALSYRNAGNGIAVRFRGCRRVGALPAIGRASAEQPEYRV